MGYVFDADTMIKFFHIYSSPQTGDIYSFTKTLKNFNVDENIASIIWQSMDVCEGHYLSIVKANMLKDKKILEQKILYQCVWCGKNTTGKKIKMEDGQIGYLPRKHSIDGDVCSGSYYLANQIINEKYIDKENDDVN